MESKQFKRDQTVPENLDEWNYQPMFKTNQNGAKMIWKIGIKENCIVVEHGHVNGAIQREEIDVELNNSGRKFYEQSLIQVNNRYLKKHREGYRGENEPKGIEGPMLAHKYEHGKTKLNYPVGCTVKLDGIRCLIRQDENIIFRSRNNKEYKHLNVFNDCMKKFFEYLPPNIELDGEMFSDTLTFNEISSIFRKEKNTDNEMIKKYIKYYIFDCNLDQPYEERWKILVSSYQKFCEEYKDLNLIIVVNTFWAKDEEDLFNFHKFSKSNGFEGTMIRQLYMSDKSPAGYKKSLYLSGRKQNILKLKDIEEEEGIIIGVEEGRGREKGIALVKLKDTRGNEFVVRPSGTFEKRKEWFNNPELILNKKMTYQYQNLSETGVPRFPVGKEIRDYE